MKSQAVRLFWLARVLCLPARLCWSSFIRTESEVGMFTIPLGCDWQGLGSLMWTLLESSSSRQKVFAVFLFFPQDFETRETTHEQMLIDPFWSFLAFEEILDLLFQTVFMPLILLNYSSQLSVWWAQLLILWFYHYYFSVDNFIVWLNLFLLWS